MAPRRAPLEEDPPSASSSSSTSTSTSEDDQPTDNEQEENHNQELPKETAESESSEDEDEEEEEVKNNKPYVQKPTPTTTATKTPQPNSPSDSDSETRSAQPSPTASPNASDFTIKPIASKPMENPKKPTSKPSAKRPVTETDEKNPKKKAKVEEEEKKSGGSVNRLWSEDDETVILKGMADFQSKKGADPSSLTGEFHEFIRKSLSVEVSRSQLMDKVRRLKKKYEINAGKGEKGADPVFSKPHEHKCFELSKKVWGVGKDSINGVDENGNIGKSGNKRARKMVKLEDSVALQPKENGKGVVGLKEGLKGEMKDVKVEDKVGVFWSAYPCLKQSIETEGPSDVSMKEPVKSFMVESMSMIGKAKAKELEKKWKGLREEEVVLYLKRVELMKEQTKLVLDAMKAPKD
ncbi:STOREKEEPER protein-like isoform X2 [Rhododendron vialii]|uniref:STOREKEEPER protein-like isoform X2 n=1 Tax=Rhododendron vialii TaxID=182163 RepID=UPI00265EC3D4|nr:STOREKEEPER protein-like isoform X2 [Rhododendron vialii]